MPLIRILAVVAALVLSAGVAHADPAITAAPAIDGTAVVGGQLRVVAPVVEDAADQDVTLIWERSTPTGFQEIPEAIGSVYAPAFDDLGHRLRVRAELETPLGTDTAWSDPTAPVGARQVGRLRIGPDPGAPVRLGRWVVASGDRVRITGVVRAVAADARLVLEPVVPGSEPVAAPLAIDDLGRVTGEVEPAVNAVAWLELGAAEERIRLGVVGVRPRIALLLGARPDGRDGAGRQLIRDLRVLPGSVVAPGIEGMRLTWEGRLPGDRSGTAVCRTEERVVSSSDGVLRGGCGTRGAWADARWRLVLEPGTAPLSAPFLPARSAWVRARVADAVPVLPTSARALGSGPWS